MSTAEGVPKLLLSLLKTRLLCTASEILSSDCILIQVRICKA